MPVRAKFKVDVIERAYWGPGREVHTIKLSAVTGDSAENKSFWAMTPGGQITLACVNPEAVAELALGAELYVDFTPAPKG